MSKVTDSMSSTVERDRRVFGLGPLVVVALLSVAANAHAIRKPVFAVVIGVNRPISSRAERLSYADDDAIMFHRMMATAGRSTLLVQADASSLRVHGKLAQTLPPTRANVYQALKKTFAAMANARERGERPQFFFIYSGHGDVKNNQGYLALSQGTLDAGDLARDVLGASPATNNHVIIDACRSYYLVHEKRAGGRRHPVKGFHHPVSLIRRFPHTGFLLSSSSDESSYEWAKFQAGIFSYELRSGLAGAADVDGDGRVTYEEIWSFIQVANRRISNDRFRPRIYMRPPDNDGKRHLLDRRTFASTTVVVPPSRAGHYLLEDHNGVRIADLHSTSDEEMTLWLPRSPRPSSLLYLHDLSRRVEYPIRPGRGARRLMLARLARQPSSYREKGAAHEAFSTIFELPFGPDACRLQLRCELSRMKGAPCPGYYCQRCGCPRCGAEGGVVNSATVPRTARDRGAAGPSRGTAHTRRPSWEPLVSARAQLSMVSRSFDFTEPRPDNHYGYVKYRSGMTPAVGLRLEAYPLRLVTAGPWAGLGLHLSYWRAIGLESVLDGDLHETTLHELLFGLRYRWIVLHTPYSPVLRFGADYGRHAFMIGSPSGQPLPNVAYQFLRFELLGISQPLVHRGRFRFGLRLDFDYRLILSAGEIERQDASGYGEGAIHGIRVAGGLEATYAGFVFGFEGSYTRYGFDFDNSCSEKGLGCRSAAGALDTTMGLDILLGYQY